MAASTRRRGLLGISAAALNPGRKAGERYLRPARIGVFGSRRIYIVSLRRCGVVASTLRVPQHVSDGRAAVYAPQNVLVFHREPTVLVF